MTPRLSLPADALPLLPPAERVERRPTPLFVRLSCWLVLAGTAGLVGVTALQQDQVVVADGELVPLVPPQKQHAWQKSTLRSVGVSVGQVVQAGDPLGQLEPQVAAADLTALRHQREALEVSVECLAATARDPDAPPPAASPTDSDDRRGQLHLAELRRGEFVTAREQRAALVIEAKTAVKAAAGRCGRLRQRVDLLTEKKRLYDGGSAVSQAERLQLRVELADAESQLADAADAEKEWGLKVTTREADLAAFVSGWRKQAAEQRAAAERELSRVRQELTRAEQTADHIAVRSSSPGLVVEVPLVSPGSTVPEGAVLFAVVPLDSPLAVEADVPAGEAARVRPGTEVRVKLEKGFPHAFHGWFCGRVEHIAPHASAPTAAPTAALREPSFRVRIRVERSEFRARPDGDITPFPVTVGDALALGLRPGAPITADAVVGRRRIFEYLLEPLLRTGRESFREP